MKPLKINRTNDAVFKNIFANKKHKAITIGKFIHSNNAYTEAMPAISPNTVVKAPKSFNKGL